MRLLVVFFLLALVTRADAATMVLNIKNTTTYNWSSGLVTLAPTITLGKTPTSGAAYYVYGYGNSSCNVVANDDGNATLLAQSLGLTLGTNAWVVSALNAGKNTSVTINVPAGGKISFITAVYGSGTEADDDVVMMHASGDPSNLSVPVFDSSGLPLWQIAYDLSGYDLNSVSQTDGNGNSCSPKCPVTGTSCWVAVDNGTTGSTISAQPTLATYSAATPYTMSGYTTDGLALGELSTAGTGNELVVVMENGNYDGAANPLLKGRTAVLSNSLTAINTFDASIVGHDFMGFPMIEAIAGNTENQFVVAEFAGLYTGNSPDSASVYARTAGAGTSTQYFTLSNFSYPGFWNMGPSAGPVVGTGNQVIVPAWNGEISVFPEKSQTPATLNTYNMTSLGEQLYGHVALANVLGTSADEIIGFGSIGGTVVALSPNTTGTGMTVAWKSVPPTGSDAIYAFGSGPAVGDLDGDGKSEIVVATAGHGAVYAYDPTNATGACKYKWTTPGGFDYAWSSPVIADIDGDNVKEVVVLSSDSVLSVLSKPSTTSTSCQEGTVEWKYTVGNGGPAWFTPALGKLSTATKNGYDVVVANYNTLEIIDTTNRTLLYRYSDSTANFYPSAVIDTTTNPVPSIFASGWVNGKVYRFDAPSGTNPAGTPWPSFMGGNGRTGAR